MRGEIKPDKHQAGRDGSYQAVYHVLNDKRTADETGLCAHELHRVDQKSPRIDRQPHRVVDQRKGNENKQSRNYKQDSRNAVDVVVDGLHLRFVKLHIFNRRMLFDGVPNFSQIGQIGIFGLHVDFIFRAERIHAKRLYQILAGVFLPLRQRLFLGDELHFCRIRGCLELLVEFGYLVRRGIAPENDADAHVFFQVGRDVAPYDADALAFEKSLKYRLHPTRSYTPDDWRRYRNAYCRLVETVDAEIGKIVDEIDRQNLWKNTVVIFASDHGDGQGAHQWNQKTALYEEVANVPFIVCLPGGKNAGKVLPQLVNAGVDLMPSVCDWGGAKVPAGRKGVSIRPIVEKGDAAAPGQLYIVSETAFTETGGGTVGWMVRTADYKYVLYNMGLYREQLFDMKSDRGEMRNLAVEQKYRDVVKQHRALLEEWMKNHPVNGKTPDLRYIPE